MTKSMMQVLLAGFLADAVSAQNENGDEAQLEEMFLEEEPLRSDDDNGDTEVCEIEGETFPFPALTDVDTEAYLGRWYQTYASRTVINSFELGGNCVTADYGTVKGRDDAITVKNTVRVKGPFNWFVVPVPINGYAFQSPDVQGELEVKFPAFLTNPKTAKFKESNYWIIELGEKRLYEGKDLYSYAVVSNKDGTDLYILVRDVAEFEANDEEMVLAGKVSCFKNRSNEAVKTNQKGCKGYP